MWGNRKYFPANCVGVLSVGASTEDGKLAAYSNWGASILAPGGPLLAATRGGSLVEVTGTSYAVPHISGLLALLSSGSAELQNMTQPLNGSCLTEVCSSGIADSLMLRNKEYSITGPGCNMSNATGNYTATSCNDMYYNGSQVKAAYYTTCNAGQYFPTQSSKETSASITIGSGANWYSTCPDYTYACNIYSNSYTAWFVGIIWYCCYSDGTVAATGLLNTPTNFVRASRSDFPIGQGVTDNRAVNAIYSALGDGQTAGSASFILRYASNNQATGLFTGVYNSYCPGDMVAVGFVAGYGSGIDNAAMYCNYISCQACPVGYSCSAGSSGKVQCTGGTYSQAGWGSCGTCTTGKYSGAGAGSCSNCPAGQSSDAGSSFCSNCQAGQISTSGGLCFNCDAGWSSSSGDSSCTACLSGTSSISGGVCASCVEGSFNFAGSCLYCTTGYYTNIAGATVCKPCTNWGYATNQISGAISCTLCPNIPSACPIGSFVSQVVPYCPTGCLPCTNAALGYKYTSGGTTGSLCSTALCLGVPIGQYSNCYTGFSGVERGVDCPTLPTNYYYDKKSNMSSNAEGVSIALCPTTKVLCSPCAAGFYTQAGCTNAKTGSVTKAPYCQDACPTMLIGKYSMAVSTTAVDVQLYTQACANITCNTGYYNTKVSDACKPCPSDGCVSSSYRLLCKPDGSDIKTPTCAPCTNILQYAYSYGNAKAGDPNSCLWSCIQGYYMQNYGGYVADFCADCIPQMMDWQTINSISYHSGVCPVGYYIKAPCLTTNGSQISPFCTPCTTTTNAQFTSQGTFGGLPDSCPFTCIIGFKNGAVCQPFTIKTCPSWTQSVDGTPTSDATCAACDMTGVFSANAYSVAMATCVAGNFDTTSCSQFQISTGLAYVFNALTPCVYQCNMGYYQDVSGKCTACPINTYNNAIGSQCTACAAMQFTKCEAAQVECQPSIKDEAGVLNASSCSFSSIPIYCNTGYYAISTTGKPGITEIACQSCTNQLLHASFSAPDPTNSNPCTSPLFVCNVGYYANQTAYQCLPCLQTPLNSVLSPQDTSGLRMYNTSAQLQASCNFACNGGYTPTTGVRSCSPCDPGYTSPPGATSCIKCPVNGSCYSCDAG